jgi:molecular chaperone DnaK (HSP70)
MRLYSWEQTSRNRLPKSAYVIGIDFGTTESSVAIYRNKVCNLIPNDLGELSTPSAVAIASDGTSLIGRRAVDYLLQRPERGVLDIKRLLGSSFEREKNGTPVLEIDGIAYTPVHFVAFILQQLREDAEAYLQLPASDAVITAPAYFDHSQYSALIQAAELAKLRVLRVLPEPVAACMGVGDVEIEGKKSINWLVYDLGGGTFDASVIELGDQVFQVMAVNGKRQHSIRRSRL